MTTVPLTDHLAEESTTGYIETYYADGKWHSRRHDSNTPFASGDEELEQTALGSQVARWNHLPHIVRAANGTIKETIPAV